MSFNELNKIAGALLGALLLFLLLGFFTEKLLGTGEDHSETQAFALEIEGLDGEETAEAAEEEPGLDLLALAQAADASAGAGVFRQCQACHKIEDGANGVGPHLYGVVDRTIGSVDGYSYSGALGDHGGDWTVANLMGFLENPKGWAPGTKMAYNGLKKPDERMNLIAYLNEESGGSVDLTAGLEAPEEASAADAIEGDTETATDATEEATTETAEATEDAAEAVDEEAVDTAEAGEETATEPVEAADEASTETADASEEAATETAEATDETVTEATEEATTETTEVAEEAAAEATEDATETNEEIVTAAADPAADPAAAVPAGMFAGISVADGKQVFRACQACHVVEDGKNRVGPHLYGVVGRPIGSVDGFRYSKTLSGKGGEWTITALDAFLENPKGWAPGTRMAYPGLKRPEDRAAVIKYLNDNSAAPLALE
ncbi:MAG: cytochrome c family protein [Pseudomonadota bacterium]